MAFFKVIINTEAFRNSLSKISREIQKQGVRTSKQAANLVVVNAKRLAPVFTGETIKGITSKRISRYGYRAESKVNGSFKQNFWANQRAPFRSPKMVWNQRNPTLYGQGHNTSGTPRFFDRAVQIAQKKYPRIAARNYNNALRGGTR